MTSIMRIALCALVAVALVAPAALAQLPPLPIDHYKTYKVLEPITSGIPVVLRDQFGVSNAVVLYLDQFANPVRKNQEPMLDPILHYAWWAIDTPEPVRSVLITNQFATNQYWQVGNGRYLLNPALKHAQSPTEPLPVANHYKCYDAVSAPLNIPVLLEDQFGIRSAVVTEPRYLCNPVEKRTSDGLVYPIVDPVSHLACYRIQPSIFYGINVPIHDQFFFGPITLNEDLLLCVPSTKDMVVPAVPQTWGRVKALYR